MYQVAQALQKLSGLKEPWEISSYSPEENKKKANTNLKEGSMSLADFVGVLGVPFTGGLTMWKYPDNAKLGLEGPSSAKAQEIVDDVARGPMGGAMTRKSCSILSVDAASQLYFMNVACNLP